MEVASCVDGVGVAVTMDVGVAVNMDVGVAVNIDVAGSNVVVTLENSKWQSVPADHSSL